MRKATRTKIKPEKKNEILLGKTFKRRGLFEAVNSNAADPEVWYRNTEESVLLRKKHKLHSELFQ